MQRFINLYLISDTDDFKEPGAAFSLHSVMKTSSAAGEVFILSQQKHVFMVSKPLQAAAMLQMHPKTVLCVYF